MDEETLNILLLIGIIVVCFIVVAGISRYETKRKSQLSNEEQKVMPKSAEDNSVYIKGQVYQMEDGTLAQYGEDGKFYKIKED